MKKIISVFVVLVALFGGLGLYLDFQDVVATSENVKTKSVQIGGQPFGIKFYSQGALITKVREDSPAFKGGLKVNDVIIKIDSKKITDNGSVREIIKNCNCKEMTFVINRDYEIINVKITPESINGKNTVGIWIKDSCAGIGTITYYNQQDKTFACLGHGICDKESSNLLPMAEGDICPAYIESVDKAKKGHAGGLNGYFKEDDIGSAYYNSEYGLFCNQIEKTNYKEYKVADKDDIENGTAYIYTTVEGDTPKFYKVEIHSPHLFTFDKEKELVIEITDKELLDRTGGIVQGMSGSPIVQNDMIVGAVTHVFVNEPTKGYGILAETMIEKSK